jgi:5'-deoxynucleotidase YfbR-like HD superfamily hydrolase
MNAARSLAGWAEGTAGDGGLRIRRLSSKDISHDIDMFLWSFKLQDIRRWIGQPYWDQETAAAEFADKLEDYQRLETVAEHSWQVADAALLLAPSFPYLNMHRAVEIALLHDKMEIDTGDANPLGKDGTGAKGHAFNAEKQMSKDRKELHAIESYIARLRPEVARIHQAILLESLECQTPEARFVKGLDKMGALAFILLKKKGKVDDKHLTFLIKFTDKNDRYFPPLRRHSQELLRRIFRAAARERGMGVSKLWSEAQNSFTRPAEPEQYLFDVIEVIGPDERTDDQAESYASPEEGTVTSWRYSPEVPSKSQRLKLVFEDIANREPARTGLEAYRQLSDAVNRVEDMYLTADHWHPPRHVGPGVVTERLYPIAPESCYPVPDYSGVDLLVSVGECVFVSRFGAMEVQLKDDSDLFGERVAFQDRGDRVIFSKADSAGDGVWNAKNRD